MKTSSNISIVSNIYPVRSVKALEYKNVAKDTDFIKQVRGKSAFIKLLEFRGEKYPDERYDFIKGPIEKMGVPSVKIKFYFDLDLPCSQSDGQSKLPYGLVRKKDGTEQIECRCEKTSCQRWVECRKLKS